jgi:hypothetical protein
VNARAVLARDLDQVAEASGFQHLRTPLRMHVSAAQLEALRRDKEISRRICVTRRRRRREPAGGGHESQPLSRASRRPVRPRDSQIEYSRLSSLSRRCQGALFAPAASVRRHANGARASPCIHGHTAATRRVAAHHAPGHRGRSSPAARPLLRASIRAPPSSATRTLARDETQASRVTAPSSCKSSL